jgi:hypothetical protein
MKKIMIALLSLSIMTHVVANAFGSSAGLVSNIIINSTNYLFFTAGEKSNSPTCGNNNEWALNLSTAKGKSIYVLLLSAQLQSKVVYVIGNGTCNEWGDREDVLYIYTP